MYEPVHVLLMAYFSETLSQNYLHPMHLTHPTILGSPFKTGWNLNGRTTTMCSFSPLQVESSAV